MAGNTSAGTAADVGAASGAEGQITAGTSLFQDAGGEVPNIVVSPAASNILGQDPKLGALANNGGPTQTMKPAVDSPVLDQGAANTLTTDQRGLTRTVGLLGIADGASSDGTDIGSVELQRVSLTVTVAGTGAGSVTSDSGGVDCGTDAAAHPTCVRPFDPEKVVVLTAVPADGSDFDAWAGDCTPVVGDPLKCTTTMSAARSVTASFKLKPPVVEAPPPVDNTPPPGGDKPPVAAPKPQLKISHRSTRLVKGLVEVKLTCSAAAACKGTLSLETTALSSRAPRAAAAAGSASFSLAAGQSTTVKIKPSSALKKLLASNGRAVVTATARLDGLSAAAAPNKHLTILPEKKN